MATKKKTTTKKKATTKKKVGRPAKKKVGRPAKKKTATKAKLAYVKENNSAKVPKAFRKAEGGTYSGLYNTEKLTGDARFRTTFLFKRQVLQLEWESAYTPEDKNLDGNRELFSTVYKKEWKDATPIDLMKLHLVISLRKNNKNGT